MVLDLVHCPSLLGHGGWRSVAMSSPTPGQLVVRLTYREWSHCYKGVSEK